MNIEQRLILTALMLAVLAMSTLFWMITDLDIRVDELEAQHDIYAP